MPLNEFVFGNQQSVCTHLRSECAPWVLRLACAENAGGGVVWVRSPAACEGALHPGPC